MAWSAGKSGWESGFSNGVKVRTFAENNACDIEIVGKFANLSQPKTGDQVPSDYTKYLPAVSVSGNIWAVQNSTLTGEEGDMATLRISCVQANTVNGAYDITWDIDMQEVQRSLKQHPTVLGDSDALSIIKLWEQTPEAIRFDGTDFWYYTIVGGVQSSTLTKVANTVAINYLKATVAGIETYNVYLPVVTKNSKYISPMTSSTFPYNKSALGHFNDPEVKPSGYSGTNQWFKSADKYSRANNGTWTRTEQWTYTDDTTHQWIYSNSTSAT